MDMFVCGISPHDYLRNDAQAFAKTISSTSSLTSGPPMPLTLEAGPEIVFKGVAATEFIRRTRSIAVGASTNLRAKGAPIGVLARAVLAAAAVWEGSVTNGLARSICLAAKCIFTSTHVIASRGLNALFVGPTTTALVICDFGGALIAAAGIGAQKIIFKVVGERSAALQV
jgi:hypothetical protein